MSRKAALFDRLNKQYKPKCTAGCANLPGRLIVCVFGDNEAAVASATVKTSGTAVKSGTTNGDGFVLFEGCKPGRYEAEVALQAGSKLQLQQKSQSGAVFSDRTRILEFQALPLPVLKVKVVSKRDKGGKVVEEVLPDVELEIKGPAQHAGRSAQDWSSFDVTPGDYSIAVKSLGAREPEFLMPEAKKATLALGDKKEVLLEAKPLASLRIMLIDREDVAIQGAEWTLDSPREEKGKTALDGLVKIEKLPLARGTGKLKITYPKPKVPLKAPPPKPPAQDPNKAPPYPSTIIPDDFTDAAPKAAADGSDADPSAVEWALKLGLQEDYADDAGVKDRLGNLGFNCNRSSDGEATKRAVKIYQRRHLNQPNGSGALADVSGDVKGRHDNA
jgi:hypothetical protein